MAAQRWNLGLTKGLKENKTTFFFNQTANILDPLTTEHIIFGT